MSGPGVVLVDRAWFNANLQSRWFIVSALGGLIIMVVVMILTSLSVAREREFGTFDQLLVAPFNPAEILIGKSPPGMFLGLMDALLFAAGAVYWFKVPFRGTIGALIQALGCFILTLVGFGLMVSSLSMTMQQALLGSFVFKMPSVILSGFATPIENMPHWLQIGTLFNPLRHIIALAQYIPERCRCEHDLAPTLATRAYGRYYAASSGMDVPAPVPISESHKLQIRSCSISYP